MNKDAKSPNVNQAASPTSVRQLTSPYAIRTTISDDRTRGSEFDVNNRMLAALSKPTVVLNETQRPLGSERSAANQNESSEIVSRQFGIRTDGIPTYLHGGQPHQRPTPPTSSQPKSGSSASQIWHDLQQDIGRGPSNEQPTEGDYTNEDPSITDALRVIKTSLNITDERHFTIESLREYALKVKAIQPRVQLVHRVSSQEDRKMYLDQPRWLKGENKHSWAIVGDLHVWDVSSYVSKNSEVSCIIYRDYDDSLAPDQDSDNENPDANARPKHTSESIQLISENLKTAINSFWGYFKYDVDGTTSFKKAMLSNPYLPIFHARGHALNSFLDTLSYTQRQHFQLFLDHILTEYKAEYELVDDMIRMGLITRSFVKYLFKPGDVVVKGINEDSRGYLCTTWLGKEEADLVKPESNTSIYKLKVWCWEFEGKFTRQQSTLLLEIDNERPYCKVIDNMDIRPLGYVDNSTKERLKRRGYCFWKCRAKHMVSYQEDEHMFRNTGSGRYMIDMKMYGELHKSKDGPAYSESMDDLGLEAFQKDDPPDEKFVFLTPRTIKGFNLKRKKWLDLQVDKIRPVIWNKQAFQHLVIREKTKRVIQALVSEQIDPENSTDLITGKGSGLIMLLHGGPGTGKTLTAESVAEIAEKPLYPVTCGDIGTEPESVESYLESVLHLGKTWGCVVLLDEADVFLEQRSLTDLRRNALVSVFLRVLEYYDGILILTSNRVGTFDEAFKSRIQLALHYKNLSVSQRTQIWGNFLSRLKEINEAGIDFVDLQDNIEKLAKHKLNGREIRNAITTARQYARWERQQPTREHVQLDYEMMKDVIETAGEFDQYIEKLNGGHSYDQLAEEDGLR